MVRSTGSVRRGKGCFLGTFLLCAGLANAGNPVGEYHPPPQATMNVDPLLVERFLEDRVAGDYQKSISSTEHQAYTDVDFDLQINNGEAKFIFTKNGLTLDQFLLSEVNYVKGVYARNSAENLVPLLILNYKPYDTIQVYQIVINERPGRTDLKTAVNFIASLRESTGQERLRREVDKISEEYPPPQKEVMFTAHYSDF